MANEADIHDELAERLLWDDGNIRRLEKRPCRTGDEFRLWCGCKQKFMTPMELTPIDEAIPIITCKCYQHTEGWAWIGKCPECDLIVFYTERGEG